MSKSQKAWILNSRPVAVPTAQEVSLETIAVGEPENGQVLVKNLYLSIDPAIRGWMSDAPSYLPPIPLGKPCWGTTVGRVVKSSGSVLQEGQLVVGMGEWAEYSLVDEAMFGALPEDSGVPLTHFLSVLGFIGFTAYFGLLHCGKPKPGDTVLVSAAAGAVGSLVGQIAKIKGCTVIGLAGGAEKCERLVSEYGFDGAIDYKSVNGIDDTAAAIAKACPDGVDVFFDNVGGDILDATLLQINQGARIVLCGAISSYNDNDANPGPVHYWQLLVKNATVEGFTIPRFTAEFPTAAAELGQWLSEGKLTHREEVHDGLDTALAVFNKLFDGSNQGKLIVKVSDD